MTTALNSQKKPAALADANPVQKPAVTKSGPSHFLNDGFCMGAKYYNPPVAKQLSEEQTAVSRNVRQIVSGSGTCSI